MLHANGEIIYRPHLIFLVFKRGTPLVYPSRCVKSSCYKMGSMSNLGIIRENFRNLNIHDRNLKYT